MRHRITTKAIVKGLLPPLIWNALRKAFAELSPAPMKEKGSERNSSWYDERYRNNPAYLCHYADSRYYAIWCVLVDRIQPKTIRCLLDIGCGPGQLASFLGDRGLCRYVGLDFSLECIQMAKLACPSFEFICADALSSSLLQNLDYEVVVATEFLEHVQDDLAVIDRIRAGAKVYGTVPNFPAEAHVRHFSSVEDVSARYSSRFVNFRADEFLFGSDGMSFFLFEGIRCSESVLTAKLACRFAV
jgi:SAM-dependent methyltransferase